MKLEPLWDKAKAKQDVESETDEEESVEPEESQPSTPPLNVSSDRSMLTSGLVPISFSQLLEQGLKLLSEPRSGRAGAEYESKYTIVRAEATLSQIDKEIYLKRYLTDKPSFIKIFFKRGAGTKTLFVLVKDRMGRREVVFSRWFDIKM